MQLLIHSGIKISGGVTLTQADESMCTVSVLDVISFLFVFVALSTYNRYQRPVIFPGGGIILMEKCLNDTKDGPISGHVWDLLVMGHCAGRLRSAKEYRELLSSVGFEDIQIAKTQTDCSTDVIYARKAWK